MPQRLILFSGASFHYKGLAHFPLRDSSRRNRPLQSWDTYPQPHWRLPSTTQCYRTTSSKISNTQIKVLGHKETQDTRALKQMRGKSKSLRWGCRSRPPPLILQRLRALVGWGGSSCEFGGSKMVFFKLGMNSSLGKKEGGIYTPLPRKSDRWLPGKSG
jgi:hypothetical protein